ncbi:apolipoprotein B-100-like [Engraulis encrasicolus]|uniref:apolipoprotein B-100-like n=1 Tax=Engraulis encrasicolus TaxID=184585 RepID=UPI002FCFCDFA
MGDTKLYLVLLLSAVALALAQRYKPFHKYEYLYEAESLNFLNGAVNGPKGSCKVEIEVPGPCQYIVRTTECTLSEVADFDAEGNPTFVPAATADAFKAAMEKNALKVTVEGDNIIKLFPEDDEPVNILNIKRGMISGFAVPVLEEERNNRMPTIFGLCKTDYTVNAREDIATDVTLTRDLTRCDHFSPVSDYTSPLALITGLNYPVAKMIKSTQTCNYQFDNAEHHPTGGECIENHILMPFSHKGKYGVTNVSKQKAQLLAVSEYNDRVFEPKMENEQTLTPHASIDKSPIQDKDTTLALLRELAGLSKTDDGHKRAFLAHRIVSMIRKFSAETLHAGVPEALEISRSLTYQALFQCGTPECNSAIMQILRTFDKDSMEIDATIYAMGLMPNPTRQLVSDMLEMAKFKQSKPIFYGASNAIKKLYAAEGKVTPELEAVAEFALEQIGDCTGDQEYVYMSLKVIGNMAAAMAATSPALKTAVIQCFNQPGASPEVQLAAIQAYRQATLPEEGREVLMQVLLDGAAPLQKRAAAYLILMKDPQPSELAQLAAALPIEENQQAKSFVISHVTNILSSTAPETQELRQKILDALQGNEVGTVMDPTKFSRNYKIGSIEGNMLFDGSSYLPKEVVLDIALNAFGFDVDMIEIGVDGKGLEPTVEALFGANGFFPDTVMKTIAYTADTLPTQWSQTLKNMIPALGNDRRKRESSQNLLRELARNVNKLFRDLKGLDAPDAMVYLRLLGMELGYLKTKDIENMAYSALVMVDNMLKMFPTDFLKGLLTSTDNELFAHYVFMDNEFYLPTGAGVPLRAAFNGVIAPGIKGGVHLAADMSEVAFEPSAAIEVVTEVGAHFPDFVQSGLEMRTNLYHDSGLKAKVAIAPNNIQLTIPAPTHPARLISFSNRLLSLHGAEVKSIPATGERVDVAECTPFFAGVKYCTALQYSEALYTDASPYFPFTGDSKLAIELHPTGEVSEYVANLAHSYEDKVDTLTLTLKAAGNSEATAVAKFNRQKYTIEADLQIPDYDLEVGLRVGSVNPETKGQATHSVQVDLWNKHVPQASLVALAKIAGMKDATVDLRLLVPVLHADAKIAAHLHRGDELSVELMTDVKLPETSSVQKITLKYDNDKLEAEIKSDVDSAIQNIIPNFDGLKAKVEEALDSPIGETGMNFRDVLAKSVETTNAYLEKLEAELPYVQNVRLPSLPELSLPEKIYLNAEADAKYHFGKHYYTLTLPLPLGGKSSGDLNFPDVLSTPHLAVPQLGLEVASIDIPVPEVFVPEHVSVSVPVLGRAEVSAKIHSNIYNLEAGVSAGRDEVDHPSYSAKVDVTGSCPVDLLCFKAEAVAQVAGTPGSLKAEVTTHVNNKLIDVTASIVEEATIDDKFHLKSNSKIDANSPLGAQVAVAYTTDAGLNAEGISGNHNLNAAIKAGPIYANAEVSQTLELFPLRPEAKIDHSIKIDSTLIKAQNTFAATFANGELTATADTTALDDALTNHAEVTLKESVLTVKSDTKADALGLKVQHVAEGSAGAGAVNIKMETSADHEEDKIHSLVTATLDVNGLAVNSDADVKLGENTATHKATLTLNKEGLATNGATSLQSPLKLENTFSASLDASKVAVNVDLKGEISEMKTAHSVSLSGTPASIAANINGELFIMEGTAYTHSAALDVHDFTASLTINNDLKVLHAHELKHTYEVKYADLVANAKCSTTGKLLGTHLSQNTEVEIAGLTVRANNDARFNSQILRFDTTTRATAVPFSFNLDSIANADADLSLSGKHTAQIYSKLLVKAEPLAFAHAHECRVSTSQALDSGLAVDTGVEAKIESMLTPSDQKAHAVVKAKVNNNAINQEVSIYNNPAGLGVEVAGTALTSLLEENQEFAISGFLKYDKSTSSHVIHLPFIEALPALLENVKITIVSIAESLQAFIAKEDLVNKLQGIPQHISDFVKALELEAKVAKLKDDLLSLTRDYTISLEDLEATLVTLRAAAEKLIADLAARVNEYVQLVKELIANGTLSQAVVQRLSDQLHALSEEFDINALLVNIIEVVEELIKQLDLSKLQDSSLALLHELDAQYGIKAFLEGKVAQLKDIIANFSLAQFVEDLKALLVSIDIEGFVNTLVEKIPTAQIQHLLDAVKSLITDLDVVGKINAVYGNVKAVLVKYELDKRVEAILEKVVELVQKFKIDETIQVVADTLKSIHIPVTETLEAAIDFLKAADINHAIEQLNAYIDALVHAVKTFDYNAFVDQANEKIAAYTAWLNTVIASLEIPQKVEAAREFVNFALSTLSGLLEELRAVKVADALKNLKDIIDTVALNDIKALLEKLPEFDLKGELAHYLEAISNLYNHVVDTILVTLAGLVDAVQKVLADQAIFAQLKQLVEGLAAGLKAAELDVPAIAVPLTDLTLPAFKVSLGNLQDSLPTQIDLPEFSIAGVYTVPAMTVTYDDLKAKVQQLIELILNFEITALDVDAFFGELAVNYLPDLSAVALPEIVLPEISLPAIPKVNAEHLFDMPLVIPEIKLPHLPTELIVPAFGKLYGEIKLNTPIYNFRSAAEFQSPEVTQYTASLTAQGASTVLVGLDCSLDSTASVTFPEMTHVVVAETLKLTSSILEVDHEATVNLQPLPTEITAKTTLKANAGLLTAEVVHSAQAAAGLADHALTFTLGQEGTAKIGLPDYTDEGTIKSDLTYTMDINTAKLTYTGDINTNALKQKQVLNADAVVLSYIKFDARIESESPLIKSSLVTASGNANFADLKVEIKANHDTELDGALSGTLSNSIHAMVKPIEIVLDFNNKGSAKAEVADLAANLDVQNDYSVTLALDHQHINTMAHVELNQQKLGYNLTVDHNQAELGIYAAVDGDVHLDFLTVPLRIPSFTVPFTGLRTPGLSNIIPFEHSGLSHLLTSTHQTLDVDTKLVYKKSRFAPILDLGLIKLPAIGKLVSEVSIKSVIVNLNVNAEISAEDDVAIHIGAISDSVFESLKAKIEGTSRLTSKSGLKLATSLAVENAHVEATHDSTLNLADASVASASTHLKVNLPILTADAEHKFTLSLEGHPTANSKLNLKYTLNIPFIKAVGGGDAENEVKLELGLLSISLETATKGNIDGTILDTGLVKGALDNTANAYLNENGLRAAVKSVGNAHVSHGDLKVELDLDEDIALEASLVRVYATANIASNNDLAVGAVTSQGKHAAKATIDLTVGSLAADVEVDLAQPSTLGDLSIYDKTVIDLTLAKQKVAANAKIVTPVYTTTAAAELEGSIPNAKGAFKISATSPIEVLVYDLDSSIASAVEESALSLTAKAVLTHAELTVDIQNVLTAAMSDDGAFRHSLNVDISSPTLTDVNFRYAARKDGASASISTPSTGFLGLQLQGKVPSQLYARLYSRFASAPEDDVEILILRATPKDGDKLHLQGAFNLDAPKIIIDGLVERIPAITSTLVSFLDKYGIVSALEGVKNTLVSTINEAYTAAISHAPDMSQLSILFRDVFVQLQKTVQVVLDAAIKFLRETQIDLPGMGMVTLPEILHKITSNVGAVLDQLVEVVSANLYDAITPILENFATVEVTMPLGGALTGAQIVDQVKAILHTVAELVKNLESLDKILEKLGETLHAVVEKTQEFIDSLHSDMLDSVSLFINSLYHNVLTVVKTVVEHVDSLLNVEELNTTLTQALEFVKVLLNEVLTNVAAILPHGDAGYLRVSNGRLEVELPFALHP